jgi:hypothetical protein
MVAACGNKVEDVDPSATGHSYLAAVDSSVDARTSAIAALRAAGGDFEIVHLTLENLDAIGPERAELRVALGRFGDHVVQVQGFVESPAGVETWTGILPESENLPVVITRVGRTITAILQISLKVIIRLESIDGSPGSGLALRIDPTPRGAELPPMRPTPAAMTRSAEVTCPPQVLDVLVSYFAEDEAGLGGLDVIRAEVAAAIALANISFQRVSPHKVALREIMALPAIASRDFDALLPAMRYGRIQGLHRLRDSLGADVVIMWMPTEEPCGLAYVLDAAASGRPDFGFAVVSRLCALSSWTLAHELGHLLGAVHDRATTARESPPRPARPYGFGFQDPKGGFRDLMAYACPGNACNSRLLYYSNPRLHASGRPFGVDHSTRPDSSADVSRMIASTACLVASYRPAVAHHAASRGPDSAQH